jgi:Fe-S oxidoreductase
MSENLRFGEAYRAPRPETFFDYSEDGGWDKAVEKCNGMAVCRKLDAGTMCPSFMVTLEEEHSTRGRANSAARGDAREPAGDEERGGAGGARPLPRVQGVQDGVPGRRGHGALQVRVPRAALPRDGRTPRPAQFFGRIHEFARRALRAAGAANLGNRLLAPRSSAAAHVDPRRKLPRARRETFRRWFGRAARRSSRPRRRRPRVILLDDTFHNYFEPQPLTRAVEVLERAGYEVEIPARQVCCGRPMISKGLLEEARAHHRELLDTLLPEVEAGARSSGSSRAASSPSATSCRTWCATRARERSRAGSFTLEEFLAPSPTTPGRLERRAVVHGHCHQKALVGMEPTRSLLEKVEGLEFTILDSGCCGMAGSFGYEKGHYEVSRPAGSGCSSPPCARPGRRTWWWRRASPAAARSPISATAAAPCTPPSCWRWRSDGAALAPPAAEAQSAAVALRGGFAVVWTGDRVNCPRAASVVPGVEARTAGRWFLGVSADLHLGLPLACTDVATIAHDEEGRWVYEDAGAFPALAPRLGIRAGRRLADDDLSAEPSFGAGVVWTTEVDGGPTRPQPWLGGALSVGRAGSRWAVQAEAGAHRVQVRRSSFTGVPERFTGTPRPEASVPLRSSKWEPLVQLTLQRGV